MRAILSRVISRLEIYRYIFKYRDIAQPSAEYILSRAAIVRTAAAYFSQLTSGKETDYKNIRLNNEVVIKSSLSLNIILKTRLFLLIIMVIIMSVIKISGAAYYSSEL